jgi:hypothetical protein
MSHYFESLLENARLIEKELNDMEKRVDALEQRVSSSPFDVLEMIVRLQSIEKRLDLQDKNAG